MRGVKPSALATMAGAWLPPQLARTLTALGARCGDRCLPQPRTMLENYTARRAVARREDREVPSSSTTNVVGSGVTAALMQNCGHCMAYIRNLGTHVGNVSNMEAKAGVT